MECRPGPLTGPDLSGGRHHRGTPRKIDHDRMAATAEAGEGPPELGDRIRMRIQHMHAQHEVVPSIVLRAGAKGDVRQPPRPGLPPGPLDQLFIGVFTDHPVAPLSQGQGKIPGPAPQLKNPRPAGILPGPERAPNALQHLAPKGLIRAEAGKDSVINSAMPSPDKPPDPSSPGAAHCPRFPRIRGHDGPGLKSTTLFVCRRDAKTINI